MHLPVQIICVKLVRRLLHVARPIELMHLLHAQYVLLLLVSNLFLNLLVHPFLVSSLGVVVDLLLFLGCFVQALNERKPKRQVQVSGQHTEHMWPFKKPATTVKQENISLEDEEGAIQLLETVAAICEIDFFFFQRNNWLARSCRSE